MEALQSVQWTHQALVAAVQPGSGGSCRVAAVYLAVKADAWGGVGAPVGRLCCRKPTMVVEGDAARGLGGEGGVGRLRCNGEQGRSPEGVGCTAHQNSGRQGGVRRGGGRRD